MRIRRLTSPLQSLLMSLLVAIAAVLPAQPASAAVAPGHQQVMVPAYFYPDWWNAGNYWYSMCDALQAQGKKGVLIANPYNGPSTSRNPDYAHVIDYCQARGQKVIGYVHTSYGARSSSAVRTDVNSWYSFYPSIDGIFFDEMSNKSTTKRYYAKLYKHVKGTSATRNYVVGNPGAAAATSWQLDAPVADAVVVFESDLASYANWTPPGWVLSKASSQIVQMVHTTPDTTSMQGACGASKDKNAGYIYITPDVMANPYDTLPPYWGEEVSACS